MKTIALVVTGLFAALGAVQAQAQAWPQTYILLPAAPAIPPTRLMLGLGV